MTAGDLPDEHDTKQGFIGAGRCIDGHGRSLRRAGAMTID